MFPVDLKSQKLKQYVQRTLGKDPKEEITDKDLKSITSLKLDKDTLSDLSIDDLVFFESLQSLSLSGINIGKQEISILNKLKNLETLSISNVKVDFDKVQYLNIKLENMIFVNCEGVNVKNLNANKNISSLTIVDCKNIQLDGISELENLKEINLPNNKTLTDKDLNDIWKIKGLQKVNLDGCQNITDTVERHGIQVSHRPKYTPTESKDWNLPQIVKPQVTLDYLSKFTPEQIKTLSGANICVTASDIEFLKSEQGRKIAQALGQTNSFSLRLHTTADLNMEDMESLNSICNFDKVNVSTGWSVTQEKGYSYQTYKAIKQEMVKMTSAIDPNLSEEKKYIELRKKLTQKKYDYAALKASDKDHDYYASRNLENVFLSGTCVCAGYADAFKNLLAEVGIESKYVEGKTDKGELHAWNQIRLKGDDGQYHWYNDDITFDATGNDRFQYSLLSDEEFCKTHTCIPSRTEGGQAYRCGAAAPAAVRAEKSRNHSAPSQIYDGR